MIELISHCYIFFLLVFIFGLIIGSFLNVIIYRLPLIMERQWRQQCEEYCNNSKKKSATETFNIVWPNSHCPHCKKQIKPWHNIPVISFIFLRGKCAHCKTKIAWQYPIVELMSAILATLVVWQFGFSAMAFFGILLTWVLIILTVIDLNHQLLPDILTLPFIWLGLIINLFHVFTDPSSAIIGAVSGYLSLWTVNQLFKLIAKKEGMGYGDFKLFALFGAWFGWQILPFIILIAAGVGSLVGLALIIFRKHDKNIPIPFGPYLAAAGWIAMMWGQQIVNWYMIGLTG